MVFSSDDKRSTSTLSSPIFEVDLSQGFLGHFNPMKPIFCCVESFYNGRSQTTNTISRNTTSTPATTDTSNPPVTTQNSTITDTNVLTYPDVFSLCWMNAPFQLNIWSSGMNDTSSGSKNNNIIFTFKGDGARNDNFGSKISSFKLYPSDLMNMKQFQFRICDELFIESVQTFTYYVFTLIFWQE